MIQEQSSRPQRRERRCEILVEALEADVLDHADTSDLVERRLTRQLPIIADLHSAAIGESRCRHALAGKLSLSLAQRDAQCHRAVALRGVYDETSPAAADVEQPITGREPKLSANQIELGFLRLVEIVVTVREVSARIHHSRVQPERVKGVSDIVVKAHGFPIAAPGMSTARQLRRRRRLLCRGARRSPFRFTRQRKNVTRQPQQRERRTES